MALHIATEGCLRDPDTTLVWRGARPGETTACALTERLDDPGFDPVLGPIDERGLIGRRQ